ncbi:DUF2726 domain-containing protein [Massilia sp. CCM 9210]|uniref:DUF2726 domain-containing protein n=1 Tax=Massilia scottii TaxID=3057166 RepID=UPI002796DD6C|nr:DUF2726 domain-containing protein [Massilia sp. CCM 9210]MDQ1817769.1 DUF2726 domain-containing protein [Massilia sp. CCM 9210]
MSQNILIIVVMALAAIILAQVWLKGKGRSGAYRARALMTPNEAEFFGRLVAALPDHYIFPQVAMSALIEAATNDKKIAHSDRLRIAQQRVDYVVCDRYCKVIAVVELDDRTHSANKDQTRDARLKQGGVRTVRFQSKNKPSVDALRTAILPEVAVSQVQQPIAASK